jgi:(2Fe-2S) ferredoxin
VLPEPPQTVVIPGAEALDSYGLIRSTRAALDNRPDVIITTEPTPTQPSGSANANLATKTANNGATTAARKSRPNKSEGPTSRDQGGVENLVISPTIIKFQDGSYIEIRCDRCGGNTSWAHEHFINGVRGLKSHLRQVHQDQPTLEWLLQRCKYRDVSAEEVEKIVAGELKIDSVSCQSTANIGMGTEYIGGPPVKKPDVVPSGVLASEHLPDAAATNNGVSPVKRKPPTQQLKTTYLENCHVVVKPGSEKGDNNFIELRCDICHGNGSYGSGKLLKGVGGFKMHFNQIHKEALSTDDVMRRCRYREVSPEEVREINAGNVSIGFIRCAGSARVRPKASYRNFNNSPRT